MMWVKKQRASWNTYLKRCVQYALVLLIVLTCFDIRPIDASTPIPAAPLISQGVPAYTSDDCFTSKPASLANDNDYSSYWRSCNASPSVSVPVTLTYDLSGVPAAQRSNILLAWYNDPLTGAYNPALISNNAYNVPGDYTIQANAAAGGSQPASGWVTLATVTGNRYHSRQHILNFSGYKWIRLSVTASYGSVLNTDVAVNMDVHSIANGNIDNWIFFGDSITMAGLMHTSSYGNTFAQQINAFNSSYFPVDEDGGVGGFDSAGGAANIAGWLATSPAKFVALNFGTNDANNTDTPASFYANMKAMVDAVIAAGRIPVIPTIPWGRTANLQNDVPLMNDKIALLYAQYPQIIHGPDLYTFFLNNQSLISGDNIHPTDPAGFTAYRTQWVNAMEAAVYSVPTLSAAPSAGTFTTGQSVTLTASKAGTIYYTIDGSMPTTASSVYSAATPVSSTTTVKGLAVDQAGNASDVLSATYTINTPSPTPNPTPSPSPTPQPTPAPASSGSTDTAPMVVVTPSPHTQHVVVGSNNTTPAPSTPEPPATPAPTPTPAASSSLKEVQVLVKNAGGNPVPNVTVTLHSVVQTAVTDSAGVATFSGVAAGEHTIAIDSPDFEGSQTITVGSDPAITMLQFNLVARQKPGFSLGAVLWIAGGLAGAVMAVLIIWWIFRHRRLNTAPNSQW